MSYKPAYQKAHLRRLQEYGHPKMSSPQDSKQKRDSRSSAATHGPQHPSNANPSFQKPRSPSSTRPNLPSLPLLNTNLASPFISHSESHVKPAIQHKDRLRVYTPYPYDTSPALHFPRGPLVPRPQSQPHQPQHRGRERPSLPQVVVTSVTGETTESASLQVPNQPRAPTIASARRVPGNE